jgi:hypothetical protein
MKFIITLDEVHRMLKEKYNLPESTKIEIDIEVRDTINSVMSEINNRITQLVTVHKRRLLAIKLVRKLTGWNLRKSMDHVDMCCNLHHPDLLFSLEDALKCCNERGVNEGISMEF